ncbi:SDR family oxidoreductase [Gammaproteobacteria bacterium]|nr:SDR family oxidoreductase [Gammaproteobacteria bacterium]
MLNKISYKNLFDLNGKVAVVTGGAGILGQHFCMGLSELGASVAVVDIDLDKAADTARVISNRHKGNIQGFSCDVSNPLSVQEMVKEVVSEFGEINILHNNAACKSDNLDAFFAPFEEYTIDQWREIMSVNIDGMFLVAQAIGNQMIKQGKGGSIIQTSSIYGVMAPDQSIYEGSLYLDREINTPAVYTTSKAAVIGLSKHLASYWAEHNIRVNTLTPAGVESGQNEEFIKKYSARIPMNRMASDFEIVGALLYLASNASSYVTGQNIIIDGGLNCI